MCCRDSDGSLQGVRLLLIAKFQRQDSGVHMGRPMAVLFFLGHFYDIFSCCCCLFCIKISKLALPGVMRKYERDQYRKIDRY